MLVGKHANGGEVITSPKGAGVVIGGIPTTVEYVAAEDAAGRISWVSQAARDSILSSEANPYAHGESRAVLAGVSTSTGWFSRLKKWQKVLFALMWPVSGAYGLMWMWKERKYTQPVRIGLTTVYALMWVYSLIVSVAIYGPALGRSADPPVSDASSTAALEPPASSPAIGTVIPSAPPSSEPSASCSRSFEELSAAGSETELSDPLYLSTLSSCPTLAEWVGGAKAHPETMGLETASEISWQEPFLVCKFNDFEAKTAVCAQLSELRASWPTPSPAPEGPLPTASPPAGLDLPANSVYVRAADWGAAWPFTVPDGVIECRPPGAVLFSTSDDIYAVNGMAMSVVREATRVDESPVWRVSPTTGRRADLGYVIDVGLELCDG